MLLAIVKQEDNRYKVVSICLSVCLLKFKVKCLACSSKYFGVWLV